MRQIRRWEEKTGENKRKNDKNQVECENKGRLPRVLLERAAPMGNFLFLLTNSDDSTRRRQQNRNMFPPYRKMKWDGNPSSDRVSLTGGASDSVVTVTPHAKPNQKNNLKMREKKLGRANHLQFGFVICFFLKIIHMTIVPVHYIVWIILFCSSGIVCIRIQSSIPPSMPHSIISYSIPSIPLFIPPLIPPSIPPSIPLSIFFIFFDGHFFIVRGCEKLYGLDYFFKQSNFRFLPVFRLVQVKRCNAVRRPRPQEFFQLGKPQSGQF